MCRVSWSHAVLLFAAGILGGLCGSVAGLASVATYPALLLTGLPPVTANVTNTVALVFTGVGSVWGSRPELVGQGPLLKRILPFSLVGGVVGAVLLLSTPAEGFEMVVPALLGFASLAILLPTRQRRDAMVSTHRRHMTTLILQAVAAFAICIYGGYFGAAAGVLLLALYLRIGGETLAHANAAKNVTLGVANGVAALIFVVVAPVQWPAVVALGLGCLVGGRLGPVVVRHTPEKPMRFVIGIAGLALAVKLGVDTYLS
ncbi:sulfite exporter TauE/SafE family protein [Mycobacterium sp. 236(2023)]|uniref:sulfite exporter TauE/SafE family protein n=1 Tax=Mycobacterium sp. 236(2023) TaxID=3038163 RepID=UPI0024154AEC|nr:sulfite exporter TauE/SafE family protein [Mycobacterium sp. 236(2023)]MDG4664651.1 sulfite exporter TauE/SafE family protein [Mycobacterium sp. 236(2023)]